MRRIVCNPDILSGKPVIENTRISVEHVLGLLAAGMTEAEILADYPALRAEDVRMALRYAIETLRDEKILSSTKVAQ